MSGRGAATAAPGGGRPVPTVRSPHSAGSDIHLEPERPGERPAMDRPSGGPPVPGRPHSHPRKRPSGRQRRLAARVGGAAPEAAARVGASPCDSKHHGATTAWTRTFGSAHWRGALVMPATASPAVPPPLDCTHEACGEGADRQKPPEPWADSVHDRGDRRSPWRHLPRGHAATGKVRQCPYKERQEYRRSDEGSDQGEVAERRNDVHNVRVRSAATAHGRGF